MKGLLAALLVAMPVIAGVIYSILGAFGLSGPGATGLSVHDVVAVLADPLTWNGLAWTIWIALVSTALAALLAIAAAATFRATTGIDRLARVVSILPLAVPHVVAALCGLLILGQSGILARFAFAAGMVTSPEGMPALVYDRYGTGLIFSLTWKEFPFLALVAFSLIARNSVELEETARSLGAGPLATFRSATLPALWRGLVPSMIAVFTFVAGNYEVAALLAPSSPLAFPLLTMERFTDSALGVRGQAFALALVATAVSIAGVAAHEWTARRFEPAD
ncbi:MAG: ABC transporter permease subunit [Gemmatimonadaceae bacterium]